MFDARQDRLRCGDCTSKDARTRDRLSKAIVVGDEVHDVQLLEVEETGRLGWFQLGKIPLSFRVDLVQAHGTDRAPVLVRRIAACKGRSRRCTGGGVHVSEVVNHVFGNLGFRQLGSEFGCSSLGIFF